MVIKTDFVAGSQDAVGNVNAINSNFAELGYGVSRGGARVTPYRNENLRGYVSSPDISVLVFGDSITVQQFSNIQGFNVSTAESELKWVSLLSDYMYTSLGKMPSIGYIPEGATGTWTTDQSGLNVNILKNTTNGTALFFGALTFKTMPVDMKVKVRYSKRTGGGSFTVKVDGVDVLPSVSCDGASEDFLETSVFDVPKGKNPVIHATGTCYISDWVGFDPSASTHEKITVLAKGGRKLTDWSNSSLTAHFEALPHRVTIMALGANDYGNAVPLNDFKTKLEFFVSEAKRTDPLTSIVVVLQCRSEWAESGSVKGLFEDYKSYLHTYCSDNAIEIVDIDDLFGGFTAGNSLGYFVDQIHPNGKGHKAIAAEVISRFTGRVNSSAYMTETKEGYGLCAVDKRREYFINKRVPRGGITAEQRLSNGNWYKDTIYQAVQSGAKSYVPQGAKLGELYLDTDNSGRRLMMCTNETGPVFENIGNSVSFVASYDFGTVNAGASAQAAFPIPSNIRDLIVGNLSDYQWIVSCTNFGSVNDLFLSQVNVSDSTKTNVYARLYNPTAANKVVGTVTVRFRVWL